MGFWVGLRARDFPTERVLSRTPLIIRTVDQTQKAKHLLEPWSSLVLSCLILPQFEHKKAKTAQWLAFLLVQTIPNKLPELLINLSSQGPHLMGATLSTLLRAVHPGTIAMTDFRQRLRPKVLTRHLGDL